MQPKKYWAKRHRYQWDQVPQNTPVSYVIRIGVDCSIEVLITQNTILKVYNAVKVNCTKEVSSVSKDREPESISLTLTVHADGVVNPRRSPMYQLLSLKPPVVNELYVLNGEAVTRCANNQSTVCGFVWRMSGIQGRSWLSSVSLQVFLTAPMLESSPTATHTEQAAKEPRPAPNDVWSATTILSPPCVLPALERCVFWLVMPASKWYACNPLPSNSKHPLLLS